jgi:putative membrane protein
MFSGIAKILFRFVANIVALQVAAAYIPGVSFTGTLTRLAWAALIITALNLLLKPVLVFIFAPIIVITLGLFSVIINVLVLWLSTSWAPELAFAHWKALIIASLLVSVVNYLFGVAVET